MATFRQDGGNEVCLARGVRLAVGDVLRRETFLEGGVALDETGIGAQCITKAHC